MRQKYSFMASLAFLGACLVMQGAIAQTPEAWPTRPITMVVPFPPGGVADTVGRPGAEALSRSLGQSVIVENKAGAGGGIGMAQVARAEPNGYQVLFALSSFPPAIYFFKDYLPFSALIPFFLILLPQPYLLSFFVIIILLPPSLPPSLPIHIRRER